MVRELADYDPQRARVVYRWPLREACLAYRARMRAAAAADYRHELAVWAAIAPHSSKRLDAPKPPAILANGGAH